MKRLTGGRLWTATLRAADARDDVLALRLRRQRRRVAREVAGLLLVEQEPLDVGRVLLQVLVGYVDDREFRVREAARDDVHGLDLGVADADHEVVALLGQRAEVRDVLLRRPG